MISAEQVREALGHTEAEHAQEWHPGQVNQAAKNLKSLATPPKNKSLATTATCLAQVQAALRVAQQG